MGIYAGVLPGPTQAFILTKTVAQGWKRTLPLAFVPLVSDLPIALTACLLISTLPKVLIDVIQIVGGFYLLFLGIHTLSVSKPADLEGSREVIASGFWKTVGINFSNPNVYIFWSTIGAPIVLTGWELSPLTGLSFVFGMYTALILTVGLTIAIFGLTGKLPEQVRQWIIRLLALAVCIFGISQTVAAFSQIMKHNPL